MPWFLPAMRTIQILIALINIEFSRSLLQNLNLFGQALSDVYYLW